MPGHAFRFLARATEGALGLARLAVLVLCVAFWVLASQPLAHAQSAQETAIARALFEEGISLADQAKWAEAADRFRRAQSLKPTPGIAFNLASALAETGKVIEASELLESLARDSATPPELKQECEAKLAAIAGKRAYLAIHVENAPAEAKVEVDGHDWPRAGWGVASPLDPGTHLVVGRSRGAETTRTELQIAAGERRELSLSFPQAAPVTPMATAPESTPAPARDEKRPLYKNWILWTCVGAVIAGGVVASLLVASKDDPATQAPIAGNAGTIRW